MKYTLTLVLAAGTLATQAGDITGKIKLQGTPPAEKPIVELKADANCGPLRTDEPKTRFYVVGADSGLADVIVYLEGISGKSAGASAAPVVIDQKGCEYLPYIAAVQTGQKVVVKNSDPVLHNVHTTPKVEGNKAQNKAQLAGAPDLVFTFDKPEEFVRFKCDVHAWMFTYVSVFDHPYFAVSGTDGSYKIANVPAGKYKLVATHRKGGKVEKEIEVKDGATTADFTIEAK
jgi:plastocyanin